MFSFRASGAFGLFRIATAPPKVKLDLVILYYAKFSDYRPCFEREEWESFQG